MISPISQNNITKSSATSVFNFINSQVDQRHLPLAPNRKSPVSEPTATELNGFNKIKMGLSAFELEKNLKNSVKSMNAAEKEEIRSENDNEKKKSEESEITRDKEENRRKNVKNVAIALEPTYKQVSSSEPSTSADEPQSVLAADEPSEDLNADKKPVQSKSASDNKISVVAVIEEEKSTKIVLPKKTKPRQEESTIAVFNFTSRKDVPDYIANDTSRTPSRPVIPKVSLSLLFLQDVSTSLLLIFKCLRLRAQFLLSSDIIPSNRI